MSNVRVTQIKSLIGYPKPQKLTMKALGFGKKGKINRSVLHKLTPPIQGMINRVRHIVRVVEVDSQ